MTEEGSLEYESLCHICSRVLSVVSLVQPYACLLTECLGNEASTTEKSAFDDCKNVRFVRFDTTKQPFLRQQRPPSHPERRNGAQVSTEWRGLESSADERTNLLPPPPSSLDFFTLLPSLSLRSSVPARLPYALSR